MSTGSRSITGRFDPTSRKLPESGVILEGSQPIGDLTKDSFPSQCQCHAPSNHFDRVHIQVAPGRRLPLSNCPAPNVSTLPDEKLTANDRLFSQNEACAAL